MNRRTRISIAAATAVAAAGTASAFLVPAASASAAAPRHSPTRTLTFTSVQLAATEFSKTISAQEDKDVNQAGQVIGFDVLRFSVDAKTHAAGMNVAADFAGGMLYGTMISNGSPNVRGTVTGGTGAFKGARGTIIAKSLDQTGARTAVTIIYHT
jgi:hypothetical protein